MTDPKATHDGPGGTPEGHTAEAPTADEYGKKGTPAAGLDPSVPHAADAEEAHSADEDHGADALGPIDWPAWAMSALGIGVALLICLFLALPTRGV